MANPTNNTNDIDLASYATPTRFGSHHGIVLAAQMAVSAPADLDDRSKAALAKVAKKAERVTTVQIARGKTSIGGLRPVIAAFDNAYGALNGRLVSATKLTVGDAAARANAIIEAVLVDGVGFLVNDAETKYAESARRLVVVEEKRLASEIDAVAGAGFLEGVKAAHAALGEAIGVGATPIRYARAELQAAVYDLAVAIADYCLQLASKVDRDDPASVQRFRAAMMPIDRYRSERPASGSDEDGDDTLLPPGPVVTNGVVLSPSPFVEP